MASVSRIIALDIGSHSVKLGEFLVPKEGFLTLTRFASLPIGLDPNKEEDRPAAVTRVIQQLLAGAGGKQAKVVFSIAGHDVFMRNVKLPAVDVLQVEQMITFEAQQIVPFPLTEVVWDFQILPGRGGVEQEAVIIAIKADLLEAENQAVEAAGLTAEMIDVGPLALYNAYRYNYAASEDCTLLIDFGARATDLLFIEGNRFYSRLLPLAGNTISQTICNEFQEPFPVAEELKIRSGAVNLGGHYAAPEDRDTARLWKIVRNVLNRIYTEINRSIVFYRNQQGGSAPQQILITGGSSCLPYLDVFLTERLHLPVSFFNPWQNVTLQPGIDGNALRGVAHSYGEVVGLALRAAGPCPLEIKLAPPSAVERKRYRRQRPRVYLALAALFLLVALLLGAQWHQLIASQNYLTRLTSETQQLRGLKQKMDGLEQVNDQLNLQYQSAQKIFTQRDAWIRLLADLNSKIPVGVWVTQLTPTYNGQSLDAEVNAGANVAPTAPRRRNEANANAAAAPDRANPGAPEINQLDVRGLFENGQKPDVINSFVAALAELPWFDIDPQKISDSIVSTDTPQGDTQLAWNYTLRLKLKKPIPLRP